MVRVLAMIGMLWCLAALPGWAQAGGPLAEGDRLMAARDYPKALQAYLAAWMNAPDNPAPIARIGDLFMASNKPVDATRFYAAAIKLNPGYEDAVAGLGYAYVQANRPDQAIALLEDPTRRRAFARAWRVQHALGLAYTKLNRPVDAVGPLRIAIEVMPDTGYLHGDLGNALYLAKDDAGALVAYDAALRLDPADAQAVLNRSCALERLARYDEAAAAVAAYLELSRAAPDDPQRKRLAALQAKANAV